MTILEAARLGGIAFESPCNRNGTCGKCRVRLSPESLERVTFSQSPAQSPAADARGWVLACQTLIKGSITVSHIPQRLSQDSATVLDHGLCRARGLAPFIGKTFDRNRNQTLVLAGEECIGVEPGDTRAFLYGAAVDIGTTTLVVSLVDLATGEEAGSAATHNPQGQYARDVLSRITYASAPQGLKLMQEVLVRRLNEMIRELAAKAGIDPASIYEIVLSGNTCMLHLAAGVDPVTLGRYPYAPAMHGNRSLQAGDLGLQLSRFARVYIPPFVSAYVGADLTAGILALQLHKLEGITLLVDIGTNGEIILADNGRLAATSTAAGPALEGMNISCGMCAGPGAVEKVDLSAESAIQLATIGGGTPQGLCGSGLIDLVAMLATQGVLEPSGRFARLNGAQAHPDFRKALNADDTCKAFEFAPGLRLTQKDVRQVQLAKGAIRAGIDFLLAEFKTPAEAVDRVYIAGAFGFHLSTASLLRLKLLPPEFRDKVEYVGNTSKTGAQAFLTNADFRGEIAERVEGIQNLELSGHPGFERLFVRSLGF